MGSPGVSVYKTTVYYTVFYGINKYSKNKLPDKYEIRLNGAK